MMRKTDTSKLVKYSSEGQTKEVFYDARNLKTQIVCLKSGQNIPPCKMNNDVLFFIVKGEGEIVVDEQKEDLKPMISVVVPKDAESRSIRAMTDMVILAVQAKDKG